ncbi:MAG: ATP-binding protein [Gemmatimonadetes bacterium]|nr:MAG: ATP-binding protein [Gemmatimonadota bacterium]
MSVTKVAEDAGFSPEEVNDIAIAVDEACTNVIKHAYNQQTNQNIDVVLKVDYQKLTIIIVDRGQSFDPNAVPLPNMDQYIEELRVGGLGIYLMKTLMDEVDYEIEPGVQNRVKMVKYFMDDGKLKSVEH